MTAKDIPASLLDPDLPDSLRTRSIPELEGIAADIRSEIIHTVSRTGGHLASSLGTVELTLALLSVFDAGEDRIIWDVGHQAYAWKLLTGRAERFGTLRSFGGISGFPRRTESQYDRFGTGHASTSISAALGMAKARDLRGSGENVIAVIGDGSLTGGMAFEALNNAGDLGGRLIVILNDNEMSISENVGAISRFLSSRLSTSRVMRLKKGVQKFLLGIPGIGRHILSAAIRGEASFKTFFTPGMLFEAFGFTYIGPIAGHDISQLRRHLIQARDLDCPVLLHVRTQKGHGYPPAENDPSHFHGVSGFEPEKGLIPPKPRPTGPCGPGFSKTFGATLSELAADDGRIVAITAAMPDGTGLSDFRARYPERFIDVGICEEHAVTMAAGLACEGFRPVVAIYSTFLQRAYDQILHDVCLQGLPVLFCLDRSGLVGQDGATHHGAFDLSYLRSVPGLRIAAPRDEAVLRDLLHTALSLDGPTAIRYPSVPSESAVSPAEEFTDLPPGKGQMLLDGSFEAKGGPRIAILAAGHIAYPCLRAAELLRAEMPDAGISVFDPVWIKPLPKEQILTLARSADLLITAEENTSCGGFSSAVLECLADSGFSAGLRILRLSLPDAFTEHGSIPELRNVLGLDARGIASGIAAAIKDSGGAGHAAGSENQDRKAGPQ